MPRLLQAERIQLHRGPDAQRVQQIPVRDWNVYLGHQRLSILDLTAAGNQPFSSEDGSFWISYNGEVYNYRELRAELEQSGCCFRSNTDTEVILKSIMHWGMERAITKFNGMWAFALLDVQQHRLVLARDRVGIKPLYVRLTVSDLHFASEIKAIAEMVPGRLQLNPNVVGQYVSQYLLDATDGTFFDGIMKVPAAHFGVVDLSRERLVIDYQRYWNIIREDHPSDADVSEDEIAEEIRDLFCDAVRLRLRSDVPVGVLVSGGIDSSAIAVSMQHLLGKDTNLNLIGMVSNDSKCDESPFIDILSRHLGIGVHKVNLDIGPQDAMVQLEKVCWHNDQPVGSFSHVAHYLLMKKAADLGVIVVLTGQGGDELLCGYKKYIGFYMHSLLRQGRYIRSAKVALDFLTRGTIIRQFTMSEAKRYLPWYLRRPELDVRGPRLKDVAHVRRGITDVMNIRELQALDIERTSVPALVHSEDRMSMSCSREMRLPFLDCRFIDRIMVLPDDLKLRHGWTKYIFRKSMEKMLPAKIAWRKCKRGFDVPQNDWLRNGMRNIVLSYFSDGESLMYRFGLIDRRKLLQKFAQYCGQKSRLGIVSFKDIFNPLAMEVWLRAYAKYL
jgi:asparagine synthase (glutamine-hydrolysing)